MNIALFGGSGFVGTRLVPHLSDKHRVIIIDKNKSAAFPDLWQFGDVRDKQTFAHLLSGIDCIINLAAEHKDNVKPENLYYDVNVLGAKNICEIAEKNGIRRIIFTSSVAVYGFTKKETDESGSLNPFNHYGKSKLEAEGVYRNWFSRDPNNSLVIIRPTVIFGENNRGNVYNLLKQIKRMPNIMIGAGKNRKSMAYVENVAAFITHMSDCMQGAYTVNYIDKPDMNMEELFLFAQSIIRGKSSALFRIPYPFAYCGGMFFDLLSVIIRKEFPVSAIRIKKFKSSSQFRSNVDLSFKAPFTLKQGLERTIKHEFLNTEQNQVIFDSE
jgi:GlcNAc-P-P-Und epimerase